MADQIKYEHRRFENLKNAIIREEAQEQYMYTPAINKKSMQILRQKGIYGSTHEDLY